MEERAWLICVCGKRSDGNRTVRLVWTRDISKSEINCEVDIEPSNLVEFLQGQTAAQAVRSQPVDRETRAARAETSFVWRLRSMMMRSIRGAADSRVSGDSWRHRGASAAASQGHPAGEKDEIPVWKLVFHFPSLQSTSLLSSPSVPSQTWQVNLTTKCPRVQYVFWWPVPLVKSPTLSSQSSPKVMSLVQINQSFCIYWIFQCVKGYSMALSLK